MSIAVPAHADWLEASSPHFTVVGDMSEAELRSRTLQLERYDAMLRHVLAPKQTIPVIVYEMAGLDGVRAAMGGNMRNVAGFYNASAQRAFAVVPEKLSFTVEDFTPQVVLFHEYAHHMLLSNTDVFMPGWAQEGLAEMFATAKLGADGSVTIGEKNDSRGAEMFGAHRWSVQRMLESDFSPPSRDEAIEKYSRGWAMVHYLWMSGERPNQYVEFINELNRTVDPVASGQKAFGDLGRLDRELNHYVSVHHFNLSTFSADQLDAPSNITVRRLSEGEAAMLNYRIGSTVGVTAETAGPLADRARSVAARYPNDVAVQVTMAEIEYDAKNYDQSSAAADRVLTVDANNMFAMVYKGRVAMRRAVAANNDAALVREARSWFRKANRANPDHALPFELYYDSFGAVGDTPPADAVAGLYRATILVPQDETLRVRSAMELLRAGEVDRARRMLAPAAFQAEGAGDNPSLKLIREMDKTDDAAALLAKAAELKLDKVNEFIEPPKDGDKDDGAKSS
ncbi:MAG: DUF1570 domain-containing protein [Croceibacterium sp.]